MRITFIVLLALCASSTFAQHLTFEEWHQRALVDIRLRPRYGDVPKSAGQLESDAAFVQQVLSNDSTPRAASAHLLGLGYNYLRSGDHVSAMYRFNQAFLLDSTNTDIYLAYGTFFMELDKPVMAHTMFRGGLSMDSTHVALLTAEATAYLAEEYVMRSKDPVAANALAEKAKNMLMRAVRYAPEDQDALQRLVVCNVKLHDCAAAWTWFKRYRAAAGAGAGIDVETTLRKECPPQRADPKH
ncbi:MAG: hypothetical protein IPI81_09800 [Flavobacteriales bacterium]|nr:hypothetical protein [Flavobacteriales bacterium]